MSQARPGPERTRLRIAFLGIVILSMFGALMLRLWFLQVLAFDTYSHAADATHVRLVPVQPARGKILDRNGDVLVSNRPSYVVSVRLDALDKDQKNPTLDRLAALLNLTRAEVDKRLADVRVLPYTPVPVATDVPENTIVYIREHQDEFPGVIGEIRPVRIYPHASLAAHAIGYVGEISADQLSQDRYRGYRTGAIVGRSGLEYAYEHDLHGKEGLVKILVDSAGKVRGEPLGTLDPRPGLDLVTTIDDRIQALTEESLTLGLQRARSIYDKDSAKHYLAPAGGAVVLDPRNGQVVAMASYPTYDPTAFVGGISKSEFASLANDPANPLLNRPAQAAFPPGSTFKAVTAAAALQEGIASGGGKYACPSSFRFSDVTFHNWKASDGGAISLPQALTESCDTVFYGFGGEFYRRFVRGGGERLQDYARAFGMGAPTGLELPFENSGRIPDKTWLKDVHARFPQLFPYNIWLPGYTINMSIGQGDVLTTPLQLALAYSAVANGGTIYRPQLGLELRDGDKVVTTFKPEEVRKVGVTDANLAVIRRGLEGVATSSSGTAKGAFAGFPFGAVTIAAKTGTAELKTLPPKQPYAWFVAYAPANNPQYLVVVMLEEAGHGGETAAPVARRIIEGLFNLPLSDITPAPKTD